MKKERKGAIRRRLGPVGLSLVAAAVTAIGFAAVSLAQSDNGNQSGSTNQVQVPPPPGGGQGGVVFHAPSAADRQKMEQFRQCMQDNGAPAPPRPDSSSGPPKPPSAAEQQKIQKAYEACKDKLPEDLQNAGPPRPGMGCPPGGPGGPPSQSSHGGNQDQSAPQGNSTPGGSNS
jgi:hypothetical protein